MKEGIIKHTGNPFPVTSDLTELMNFPSNTVLQPDFHVIKQDSIGTERYHDFVYQRYHYVDCQFLAFIEVFLYGTK